MTDSRPFVGSTALALTFVAALIAGFAASADAAAGAPQYITPHQEETFKPYVARVYFDTKAKDGSDAYFEILKDDKQVYVQRAKNKGEKFFIGTMYKEDPDAPLVKMGMDVTGDGKPDLVISEWSGYANCCLTLHIFEIGPTFKKLGTIDAEFSDSGPHFLPPDKRSQTLALSVQIHDWNFANWHTDFADSPAPKVLLRFSNGAYRIAPDLMRTQAPDAQDLDTRASAVKNYAPSAKGGTWPHAEVSPDLMVDDARSDLWRPRRRGLEVSRHGMAVEGEWQGRLRPRLPRATRQESLLACGQDDECFIFADISSSRRRINRRSGALPTRDSAARYDSAASLHRPSRRSKSARADHIR